MAGRGTLVDELRRYCRDVREHEPLRRHVTFRIGGPADILLLPRSVVELRDSVAYLYRAGVPFVVLGAGSNVLIADAGIRGVVIKIGKGVDRVTYQGVTVVAEAGVGLPHLSREAANRGLAGLEFAAGIPGSVGGAVVMNAGAHGHAMAEVVRAVRVVAPEGERVLGGEALRYGYRRSALQDGGAVVLE
ncbi:MAG TPA: FAD-binding protein, partial [bacterium]|nr:FAD-binding protein [bacterium]